MIIYLLFLGGLYLVCGVTRMRRTSLVVTAIAVITYLVIMAMRSMELPDQDFYSDFVYRVSLGTDPQGLAELLKLELGFAYLMAYSTTLFNGSEPLVLAMPGLVATASFLGCSWLLVKKAADPVPRDPRRAVGPPTFSPEPHRAGRLPAFAPLPYLLLYVANIGTMYNFCVLRAGVALAFQYASLFFALQGRHVKTVLPSAALLAASMLFHRSAIIGVIPWAIVLFGRPMPRTAYLVCWIAMVLLYLFRIDQYFVSLDLNGIFGLSELKSDSLFGSYLALNQGKVAGEFSVRIAFYILVYGAMLLVKPGPGLFTKLLNVQTVGMVVMVLGGNIAAFSRVTDFFTLVNPLLVYLALQNVRQPQIRFALFSAFVIPDATFTIRLIFH